MTEPQGSTVRWDAIRVEWTPAGYALIVPTTFEYNERWVGCVLARLEMSIRLAADGPVEFSMGPSEQWQGKVVLRLFSSEILNMAPLRVRQAIEDAITGGTNTYRDEVAAEVALKGPWLLAIRTGNAP